MGEFKIYSPVFLYWIKIYYIKPSLTIQLCQPL